MSTKPIVQDEFVTDNSATPSLHAVPELDTEAMVKSILADVLGLDPEDANALEAQSGLFGHLPELDSMAVAGLLTEIEDRLDIVIEDDDVDGEMLETFGGLLAFVEAKTAQD